MVELWRLCPPTIADSFDETGNAVTPKRPQKRSPKKEMPADNSLSAVIKAARTAKGLSQEELARLLGYDSGQFVSDWERGHSAIPMKKLAEVCTLLELDRDHLFDLLLDYSITRLSDSMHKEFERYASGSKKK